MQSARLPKIRETGFRPSRSLPLAGHPIPNIGAALAPHFHFKPPKVFLPKRRYLR